jgi:nucleoside-diphosphate-sugar epimerase/2-polyprenyl-3-methyl-5-hydroxy-6-metoxy-1,4-benzoquinol methylase
MSLENINNKILVIGGRGYCGSFIVDNLIKNKNYRITIVDPCYYGNIKFDKTIHCLNNKIQDLPKEFLSEFNVIILLGGQGSASNNKNLLNVIDNNIRNFSYIISNINKNQKFIYASSSSVYGRTDNKDVDETYNTFTPYNYYDWSKESIDQLTKIELDKNKDLQIFGLRFGTVNGFSRNFRNDVMINSMVYNAINNGKIFVTNHNINRPILGINDLFNAINTIIEKGISTHSGIYNLNSFNSTVGEIGEMVSKIVGVPIEEPLPQDNVVGGRNPPVNFKMSSTAYDFRINSDKFIKTFDFKFYDTLSTITQDILSNFDKVEHFENRLVDRFDEYVLIERCRVCDTKTESLLDLNSQPLANAYTKFHKKLDYNPLHVNVETSYPLHLHYCPNCFHVQLNCVVSPDLLFKDYIYVSGTSKTLRDYFDCFALNSLLRWGEYAEFTEGKLDEIKVLDIATNDASQLDAYHKLSKSSGINITTVGVDPAENIYKMISSKKTEHDLYCEFFGNDTVNKLEKKYGTAQFDIIVAQNVFAHTHDVNKFLTCAKELLSEKGIIFIQTSQKNMILEHKADTAYHEHLSFFNTNSMKLLCQKNGLILNNVMEDSIHGISYIFEITKTLSKNSNVVDTLLNEMDQGFYDKSTYTNYPLYCIKYKNQLHNKLIDYKLSGKNIIGFGSTAKSNTILNFAKIGSDIVDFIIDENPLKQNLFTPGTNIIVSDISSLKLINENTIILIVAWNFEKEIIEKIKSKLIEYNIDFPVTLLNMDTLKTIIINDNFDLD